MDIPFEQYQLASLYLQKRLNSVPETAVVLGTGLSSLLNEVHIAQVIPYHDIPGFPATTVEGHKGELILAEVNNCSVIILSGRFHYYEGYSMKEVTFPIRVLQLLGIQNLLLSNVAGSVNPNFKEGNIVFIKDHINMLPQNPLRGKNIDAFGIRFPDMLHTYSSELLERAREIMKQKDFPYLEGVYLALQGPNLETPAEYNMYHIWGADLIGMSTVPEVIVAKQAGMNILCATLVSNVCFPIEAITETTVEEVIKVAEKGGVLLSEVFGDLLKYLELEKL